MTMDELAAMPRSMCILQISGLRPFYSKKYDITRHKNYKMLMDGDKANEFNIQKYWARNAKKRREMEEAKAKKQKEKEKNDMSFFVDATRKEIYEGVDEYRAYDAGERLVKTFVADYVPPGEEEINNAYDDESEDNENDKYGVIEYSAEIDD